MRTPGWVSLALGLALLAGAQALPASDDGNRQPRVAPVTDALYLQECGSCHFAYQPGLLPAASWENLLGSLDRHFGDNVELPEDTRAALARLLTGQAADRAPGRLSQKIARALGDSAPLRITEIRYIAGEHREVPARVFANNPQLTSLSQCDACHTDAATGRYAEHAIRIPGIGRWDD